MYRKSLNSEEGSVLLDGAKPHSFEDVVEGNSLETPTDQAFATYHPRNEKNRRSKKNHNDFIARHRFGGQENENDSGAEDDEPELGPQERELLATATPITRRAVKEEKELDTVKKIGPAKTFFTLIKGFVATAVLFLPKGFKNGGYIFAPVMLTASAALTFYCSLLLLRIREKMRGSFSDLGMRAFGNTGKRLVDVALAVSQIGFVTAYIVFISENLQEIIAQESKSSKLNIWVYGGVCFVLLVPLVWVRKIQKFAYFHIFADLTIVWTVCLIVAYTVKRYNDSGKQMAEDLTALNSSSFLSFAGMAVYMYEGIGLILPVRDTCDSPEKYPYILGLVFVVLCTIYVFFGLFTYFVFGPAGLNSPMITEEIPRDTIVVVTELFFILNLMITYPLVLHPANMVIESVLFKGWPKSRKRTWFKNVLRAVIVAGTVAIGLGLRETLDKLMSVVGSVSCAPIAFIFPTLFHYKLLAQTRRERIVDLSIAALGAFLMVFITIYTLVTWNKD